MRVILLLSAMFVAVAVPSFPQSNINPALPYAWGENIGWTNFEGDGSNGAVVNENFLGGYVWNENVGWIFLGDGTPTGTGGTVYTQAAGDTGVNIDPSGNLSGFAWGENIGWVNFTGTSVDFGTGQFSGYAWGENVGWINLDSGFGVRTTFVPPPTDVEDWMILDE